MSEAETRIEVVPAERAKTLVPRLAEILMDCVEGGASVSFMAPLGCAEAEAFWEGVARAVERDAAVLLVAQRGKEVLGTLQVLTATPPNQKHRAELSKLLVHRAGRGRGLARALLQAAEEAARERSKSLITLDTAAGSEAERLYERFGYERVGLVPNYALFPDGTPCGTVFFYKSL